MLLLLQPALNAVPTAAVASGSSVKPIPDEPSLLPFMTTDVVIRRNLITGQLTRTTGVIEGISGDVIDLRRSGLRTDQIYLREVTELQFRKSKEYEQGLIHLQKKEYTAAVAALEAACAVEPRRWVLCEIRSSAAKALLALGRYDDVIQQLEQIIKLDPKTRHVSLLPLVWDERLPQRERFQAMPQDLSNGSPLKQLTAAAALLHLPQHQPQVIEVLTRLRTSDQPYLRQLAEIQLWRLPLLRPGRLRQADTSFWRNRVHELDAEVRGGAEFLLGRAFLLQHDYDAAALSLMWMPMMSPHDPATAASSLFEASVALVGAGRHAEASRVLAELAERFPDSSVQHRRPPPTSAKDASANDESATDASAK